MTPTLENVVVRPDWFFSLVARRASRSRVLRRLSPRRSCGLQGDRVLALRGSLRGGGDVRGDDCAGVGAVRPVRLRGLLAKLGDAGCPLFFGKARDVSDHFVLPVACAAADAAVGVDLVEVHRCAHFVFPWLRPFGLFLSSSDHSLSQPLGFVNWKKKKSFDYFLGRKTGRKAYTHNPGGLGTTHKTEDHT